MIRGTHGQSKILLLAALTRFAGRPSLRSLGSDTYQLVFWHCAVGGHMSAGNCNSEMCREIKTNML